MLTRFSSYYYDENTYNRKHARISDNNIRCHRILLKIAIIPIEYRNGAEKTLGLEQNGRQDTREI